jgi:hypothetical protein
MQRFGIRAGVLPFLVFEQSWLQQLKSLEKLKCRMSRLSSPIANLWRKSPIDEDRDRT